MKRIRIQHHVKKTQLITMQNRHSRKIFFLYKSFIIIMILFMSLSSYFLSSNIGVPISITASETIKWNITLQITDLSGLGNTVIFGQATDASDGKDKYDIAAPPMPPQYTSIIAWFQTPFPDPFNQLIHEYKKYPSTSVIWNLSLVWIPEPANTTSTTIRIKWNSFQVAKSRYQSLLLLENNTVLVNMLTTNSYSFITNGTVHNFQILSENQLTNNSSEQYTILIPQLLIFLLVIFMVSIIVFLILHKKIKKLRGLKKKASKKNHRKSQKKNKR